MRTALFILAGFGLLAAAILIAWHLAPRKHAATAFVALAFMPLWFLVAVFNLWTGMQAGYGFLEEAPIFLAIALPPVLLAVWIHVRFRHA
ncbi:hypothetical protein sos41_14160 [Alphaproteobacteria bacterium SO-S41]|nr:hypothetical protein sos41_14160 [Alphaproteobacteria bacterium SO-S41]